MRRNACRRADSRTLPLPEVTLFMELRVNTALTGTESDMTQLAGVLDYWNNGIVV